MATTTPPTWAHEKKTGLYADPELPQLEPFISIASPPYLSTDQHSCHLIMLHLLPGFPSAFACRLCEGDWGNKMFCKARPCGQTG